MCEFLSRCFEKYEERSTVSALLDDVWLAGIDVSIAKGSTTINCESNIKINSSKAKVYE